VATLIAIKRRINKMKTHRYLIVLFIVAFAFGFSKISLAESGVYSAKLISPRPAQVLYPGQVVRVEWKSELPNIYLGACEMEVFLSLDGGRTFPMLISPWMDPKAQYFYWTVPNTPTNAAVLDIRFGCEPGYPESYAPQPASTFVIAKAPQPPH
jgi:hypothetical protein